MNLSGAVAGTLVRVALSTYAKVLGVDPLTLTLASGQRHDVVLDADRQLAWRFPRTASALRALPGSAGRAARAYRLGLGAPEPVDLVLGPLGIARMGSRFVGGIGLSPAITSQLSNEGRRRLVSNLAETLARMAAAPTDGWPGDPVSWAQRWLELSERVTDEVIPLIGACPGRERASQHVQAALEAARACQEVGVTHGDLGGENLHVDPDTGAVLGILDWDEAAPGDPAVDLAAILAHAEPWLREDLLAVDERVRQLAGRAEAYLATFALQESLWGCESSDDEAVGRGLAGYH